MQKMADIDNRCNCNDRVTQVVTKYGKLEPILCTELKKIAEKLTTPGKGIIDIEEPCVPSTNKSNVNQIIAPEAKCYECIAGIVLQHESVFNQTCDDVRTIPESLLEINIVPGVQVDKGTVSLFGTFNETTTQGLDNLQERCIIYKKHNCHFTRWKCVYKVSEIWPTQLAVVDNANVAARFASITQSARMVPLIQLEVKIDGDYSIMRAQKVHETILSQCLQALIHHHVYLPGIILIPTIILPGIKNAAHLEPYMIAEYTLNILKNVVPPSIPAIMFLNSNQTFKNYLINLNALIVNKEKKPWTLSFCYSPNNINEPDDDENIGVNKLTSLKSLKWCREACQGQLNVVEVEKYFKNELNDQ